MKPPPNPLSEQLRSLRKQAGLSGAEAAKRAGLSAAKISRTETGAYMPTVKQVETLCRVYKASPDVRRELVEMTRGLHESTTSARVTLQRGGWQMQERIGRIESASSLIRGFSSDTIIGLTQAEGYIREMIGSVLSGEALDRTVAARLDRQRVLNTDRQFHFVMSEGALRWNVGGAKLMVDQLAHLAELSRRENVLIGVIPWTTTTRMPGAHAFHLYDKRAVIVGTMTATAIMSDSRDVADYDSLFSQLEGVASFGDAARAVIDSIAADYRSLID